jgi:hypothetical protein
MTRIQAGQPRGRGSIPGKGRIYCKGKKKGKAIPVTGRGGP